MLYFRIVFISNSKRRHSRYLCVENAIESEDTSLIDYYNQGYCDIENLLKEDPDCVKRLAEVYYENYCEVHKVKVEKCLPSSEEYMKQFYIYVDWDKHSYIKDMYSLKASNMANLYKIVDYQVQGKYMTYIENCVGQDGVTLLTLDKPCTFQRKLNLETCEIKSKKLNKFDPDGWKNTPKGGETSNE